MPFARLCYVGVGWKLRLWFYFNAQIRLRNTIVTRFLFSSASDDLSNTMYVVDWLQLFHVSDYILNYILKSLLIINQMFFFLLWDRNIFSKYHHE